MGRKLTTEIFILRAIDKYGDRYSYEDVLYIGNTKKINITCKVHGVFSVRPSDFLNGVSGCQLCSGKKRISKEEFVKQSNKIHNKFYDYSNVVYINKNTKVLITCPIHGDFEQCPTSHLISNGCAKCGIETARQKRTDTVEEFIKKAKEVHGDRYGYLNTKYISSKTKVTITCSIHGDFEQKPNAHIFNKQGCMKCAGSEKLTTESFIEKANKVHNNIYDYSKIDYTGNKIKVVIICKKHGEFKQKPSSHINSGHGCPKCAGTEKLTTEIFVQKAKSVHGDLYDYSLVEYKNSKIPLIIICNIHGEFAQNSNSHISNRQGCPTCGGTEKLTTTSFIEKSNMVHCGLYSYDSTEYINSKTKIIITCPIHGDFSQDPSSHLQKVGCPTCSQGYYSIKRAKRHVYEWNKIPAILYFLKIKTNDEEFYKIGLTKKTINKRFSKDNFKIEVLKEYHTNLYNACILESIILEENKQYKYEPKTIFGGHTECFNKNILIL